MYYLARCFTHLENKHDTCIVYRNGHNTRVNIAQHLYEPTFNKVS